MIIKINNFSGRFFIDLYNIFEIFYNIDSTANKGFKKIYLIITKRSLSKDLYVRLVIKNIGVSLLCF